MAAAVNDVPARRWRPNPRLWLLFGTFVAGSVALGAISDWRAGHLFLINTSDSLPNWAFLINRGHMPGKGDYVFFEPPASALLRRHFGDRPEMFGKIVYGVPGDIVGHDGGHVTINGVRVARMKAVTRFGEPLTAGATGPVPQGCFFAATPHKDGFDSRYAEIGFVCARQIIGTGEPVL